MIPQDLAGKTVAEIERIELQTTRMRVTVGDVFRLREGDPEQIRIEGGSERLDRVGTGMTAATIRVEGRSRHPGRAPDVRRQSDHSAAMRAVGRLRE